jgi:hypothetical protein
MKTLTILFLLFSTSIFAQTQTKTAPLAKPSTTDCPTWGSKPNQAKSKAAYYESLRHTKKAPGDSTAKVKAKPKAKTHTPSYSAGTDKVLEQKKKE